jgi:putative membrane protein
VFRFADDPLILVTWQIDPVLIGGLLAVAVAYGLAVGPLRERLAPAAPFDRLRALAFTIGLALFYLVEGSPLHDLAERYLLSAHMVQHLLLSYVIARLLLVGVPPWLWRRLLLNRRVAPIARVALRPVVTFTVFSAFFALWHVPVIYEGALMNSAVHHIQHLLFLFTAMMLWWPILSPLPELPRSPHLVQLVYLFTLPIAQLPVFAIITFAPEVIYRTYEVAPRVYPWLSPLADQALAGAIMKVMGLLFFAVPFTRIFFEWYRTENPARGTPRALAARGEGASGS